MWTGTSHIYLGSQETLWHFPGLVDEMNLKTEKMRILSWRTCYSSKQKVWVPLSSPRGYCNHLTMYSKDPLITIFTFHHDGMGIHFKTTSQFFPVPPWWIVRDMLSSFAEWRLPGRLRVGRRSTKKSGSLGQQGASDRGEGRSQFRRAEGGVFLFLFESISGDILEGPIRGLNEEGKGSGLDMMWLCYKMIVPPNAVSHCVR